jgi:hypothetical protein
MESLLLYNGAVPLTWQTALLCTLVAFLLSSVVAKIYETTHQGLSYSRSLVQALVLGSIVGCLIMLAIGDNVARSIGIVGSLAIIRFRTNLRDPRDMVFVFAAIGIGVAAGVQSFLSALVGTAVFSGAAVLMWKSEIGSRRRHDGLVRLQAPADSDVQEHVSKTLRALTSHFALVTMHDIRQGAMVDCSYQVRLAPSSDPAKLLAKLQQIEGVVGLSYMNQTTTVEV